MGAVQLCLILPGDVPWNDQDKKTEPFDNLGDKLYRTFAKLYPRKFRKKIEELLTYANVKIDSDRFIGFVLVSALLLSLVIAFNFGLLFDMSFLPLAIGSFILIMFLVYIWLLLTADSKGKFIEKILPDALQLMSSNLRAGLTTDRALLLSARPEFGPFQDEINLVGKEITLGKPITEALAGITKRVRSQKLERTIELVTSGIKSGGELASLLDQTASDLRRQQLVDKKIRSSVNMYVIFIFIAAGIASPILFGLSSYLVEVLTKNFASAALPETTTMDLPINFSNITISVNFIIKYAITSMLTTAFLGSFILGLISNGKEKDGIKFMLPLAVLSIVLFFVARALIKSLLGGLFGA